MPLLFAKNDCGCFLLSAKKFEYGILLLDITYDKDETMGTFMMQDKRVATYGLRQVQSARSKLTKGLKTSEIKTMFTLGNWQKKLEMYVCDALAIPGQLDAMISASRLEFSQKTKPGRPRVAPRNPYPVKKTKVATKTEEFRVPNLTRTRTGWCEGVVIEYNPNHPHPYRIEWKNDPKVYENCNLDEMNLLTHHYKECDKRRLLDIDCVGKEILWLRPIPNQPRGGDLVCGTVMFFDEALEKYKLLYRDGRDEWVSGEKIDDNLEHEEGYNLQDKIGPVKEPWHRDAQRKINTYGEYCVKYVGTLKWGSSPTQIPKKPSQLSQLVKAVEANVSPPSNIPLPIVKAVTNIVMGRLTATSSKDPSPINATGLTLNTPESLLNVAPLVQATHTGLSEPSSIMTESPSTSITAGTTNTQPEPLKILKDPLVMDTVTSLLKPASTVTESSSICVTALTSINDPDKGSSALHQQLLAAKLKLNVALLHKKLAKAKQQQEAKAKQQREAKVQQQNMVLAGNKVETLHPTCVDAVVVDSSSMSVSKDADAAVAPLEIKDVMSTDEGLQGAQNVSSTVEGASSLCNTFTEDNKADVNAGVVDSSLMSLSTNANAAVGTLEINVVMSTDEGLQVAPNVSSKVEGAGSLCNTCTKDNKANVTATVESLPTDIFSGEQEVNNCANS
jgi:hypothetical protein